MKKILISLISILSIATCWKPIEHPAAFTVHQTFHANEPVLSRKSSNEIFNSDSVDSLLDSFHKTGYSSDNSESALGINDGRSSKALHFESNKFNGIFHDVSRKMMMKIFSSELLPLINYFIFIFILLRHFTHSLSLLLFLLFLLYMYISPSFLLCSQNKSFLPLYTSFLFRYIFNKNFLSSHSFLSHD